MLNVRKVNVGGYDYLFTEIECEKIEKYFDSIRVFMDDFIVDNIVSDISYGDDEYDVIKLVAYYDWYLSKNKMKRMIKLGSNWYSQNDLEFLLSLLNQQESTDKMKVGAYVFDYCGSTILVNIDSDGDIILVNIAHEKRRDKMKKVTLDLKPIEVEYLVSALNDSMEKYKDNFELFEILLDLKLKIRKEYEICIMLD